MSAQLYWVTLIVSWVELIQNIENHFEDIFKDFEKQKNNHFDLLKKIVNRNHTTQTESST